jgi:hypothetical protein
MRRRDTSSADTQGKGHVRRRKGRRSADQGERPHKKPTMVHLDLELPASRTVGK